MLKWDVQLVKGFSFVRNEELNLCLHGLPRGNKRVWKSITNNLIYPNKIKSVSIHCWNQPATLDSHHGTRDLSKKLLSPYVNYFCSHHDAKVMVERQNLIEPMIVDTIYGKINHSNRLNSLLSQWRVLKFAPEQNLILCRSDVYFSSPVKLNALNDEYWLHSGVYSCEVKRYEFEDVLMYFPQNPVLEYEKIINSHMNLNAYKKNVYNSQIYYIKHPNQSFENITYGKQFWISRNRSIFNIIRDEYYKLRKFIGIMRRKFRRK